MVTTVLLSASVWLDILLNKPISYILTDLAFATFFGIASILLLRRTR